MKKNLLIRTDGRNNLPQQAGLKVRPITLVVGPLGAGKTTVVDNLLVHLLKIENAASAETRVDLSKYLVITNDLGKGVDNERLQRWHRKVHIRHIEKDCACCDGREQFAGALHDTAEFEHIIVEPSGAAQANNILATLPREADTYVVGVMSAADFSAASSDGKIAALHCADVIAVTRALSHQQRAIRERIAAISAASVCFLPDPYKKTEPGMLVSSPDQSWQIFIETVLARNKTNKQWRIGAQAAPTEQLIGKGYNLSPLLADDLYMLLKGNCERAKGVTTIIAPDGSTSQRSFDYAYGTLRLHEEVQQSASAVTIIAVPRKHQSIAQTLEKELQNTTTAQTERCSELAGTVAAARAGEELPASFQVFNNTGTQQVLAQADRYFGLAANKAQKELAGETFVVEELEAEMDELGEKMFFDSAIIWLSYKVLAYGKEQMPYRPAPIRSWAELLAHASPKGYICTNRLNFLRRTWRKHASLLGVETELDQYFPPNTDVRTMVADQTFQRFAALIAVEWLAYERSALGKWKNF